MPTDRQLDDRISRWLEAEAPTQLPDRVLRATLERTRRTRQEASWQQVLRLQMNRIIFGLGGAAVVVLAAALALGIYVNNPRSGVGDPPSPSPTTEAPSPSTEPSPNPTSAPTTEPTATPEPTSTPDVGLPVGPFEFEDRTAPGIAMTVTIPTSGWKFVPLYTGLEKGVERANMLDAAVFFWPYPDVPGFNVYGDPCQWVSTTPDTPVTTVDDFAAALAAQASRDASEPTDVMIGRYAGKSITLHVPEDAVFDDCDHGEFASYGVAGESGPSRWHQGPGQIDELWILDVDGTIVIITVMYRPDTSEELVEETRTIVESTTFGTP